MKGASFSAIICVFQKFIVSLPSQIKLTMAYIGEQMGLAARKMVICLAMVSGSAAPGYAQLVINELMQSNIDCVMDDLKDYPDSWVELYNSGTTSIRLNERVQWEKFIKQ